MIHAGNAITVQMLTDGIAEFRFDLQGESVNKFNRVTIDDFQAAIDAVKADQSVQGLIVTSAKPTFPAVTSSPTLSFVTPNCFANSSARGIPLP